jgi:hypothetical protein
MPGIGPWRIHERVCARMRARDARAWEAWENQESGMAWEVGREAADVGAFERAP